MGLRQAATLSNLTKRAEDPTPQMSVSRSKNALPGNSRRSGATFSSRASQVLEAESEGRGFLEVAVALETSGLTFVDPRGLKISRALALRDSRI